MKDELLTTAQVAQLCGRHPRTIARWVIEGRITPAHRLPGENGAMLFRAKDVASLATPVDARWGALGGDAA